MAHKVNPILLQKYLKGVNYPAHKGDLVAKAKSTGRRERLTTLERLRTRSTTDRPDKQKRWQDKYAEKRPRANFRRSARVSHPQQHNPGPPRRG